MKKEILNEAFYYLRSQGKVHTKKDLSNAMSYNVASVSRAFSGDMRYLTEDFLDSLNRSFDNIFNREWLLTGEGEMLVEDAKQDEEPPMSISCENELHREAESRLWSIIFDYQANNRRLNEENSRLRAEVDRLRVKLGEKKGKARLYDYTHCT